jgi:signal peptidase II
MEACMDGMQRTNKLILIAAMAASVAILVAIDQWTKAIAASLLAEKGPVNLIDDFVVLIFVRNRGAFLSLGSGLPPVLRTILLIVFPIAALAFLGWAFLSRSLAAKKGKPVKTFGSSMAEFAVVVLVAAGGAGNLVDRLRYGEVRDFLNFGIGRLRTGIMNMADLYILAALIVMAGAVVGSRKPWGSKGSDAS